MVREKRGFIKKEEEFEQRIIDVARVTRVMAGGKRMKFRVCLAIGDKKGRIGVGLAKGSDVTLGIGKAFTRAKKNIVKVPLTNETILHPIKVKFKAAQVLLKPAKQGSGIKAGGAVRILCELAGIPNITAKILGSNNKVNNVKATMLAFQQFKQVSKKNEFDTKTDQVQEVNEKKEEPAEKKVKEGLKDKLKNLIKKKESPKGQDNK